MKPLSDFVRFDRPPRLYLRTCEQDEQVSQEQLPAQGAKATHSLKSDHKDNKISSGKTTDHSLANSFSFEATFPTITRPTSVDSNIESMYTAKSKPSPPISIASTLKSNHSPKPKSSALIARSSQSKQLAYSNISSQSFHTCYSHIEHQDPPNSPEHQSISIPCSKLIHIRNKSEPNSGRKNSLEWPSPFPNLHRPSVSVSSQPTHVSKSLQHDEIVNYLFSETLPGLRHMRKYHSDTTLQALRDTARRDMYLKWQREKAKKVLEEELQQSKKDVEDSAVFEDDNDGLYCVSPLTLLQDRKGKHKAKPKAEAFHLQKFDPKSLGQRVDSFQGYERVGSLISSYMSGIHLNEMQDEEQKAAPLTSSSSSTESIPANDFKKYFEQKSSSELGGDEEDNDEDDEGTEEDQARQTELFGNWDFPHYENCGCGEYQAW
jgi:hypothetical protein